MSANPAVAVRRRIIITMSELVLSRGFSAVTVADLAAELGMSKKTIYLHFPTKQAIAAAAINDFCTQMRSEAESVLANHMLTFEEKLHGIVGAIMDKLGRVRAEILRDFQRHEPELYQRIEAVRSQSIPYLFGRLLEEGRMVRKVREDVNLALAAEYHLHAIQGLMNPETLGRLKLTPSEAGQQAIQIFFNGMLLPSSS